MENEYILVNNIKGLIVREGTLKELTNGAAVFGYSDSIIESMVKSTVQFIGATLYKKV